MLNPEAFKADPMLFVLAWALIIALPATFLVWEIGQAKPASESSDETASAEGKPDEVLLIGVERRGNRQYDRINKKYLPNGELVDEDEKFEVKRPSRKQLPRGKN